MTGRQDVARLLRIEPPGRLVLSLYLPIPATRPGLRDLSARAAGLISAASGGDEASERARLARRMLEVHGRDWLGHTVAIFTDGQRVAEAVLLPCEVPEQAVLAIRPQVRPLLAALDRRPDYQVAMVTEDRGWLFRVAGDHIDVLAGPAPGSGRGGWFSLGSRRVHDRVHQLPGHPPHEIVCFLEHAVGPGEPPVVVTGGEVAIPRFLAVLPPGPRERIAGTVPADPALTTAARARQLAEEVIVDWVSVGERRLAATCRPGSLERLTVAGLADCLAAVSARAVQLLLLPDSGLLPGFACRWCGALASTAGACPHGAQAARPVPDLLEEMAAITITSGGDVATVRGLPTAAAAQLRPPPAVPMPGTHARPPARTATAGAGRVA